jgi:acyl-CoA dehydrogenase
MEYNDSEKARELVERTREVIDSEVIPVERELSGSQTVPTDTIDDLREKAKEYDIYAPQISREYGGMGVDFRDVLPVFEEAGRSLLGPRAVRVDAPDEGNMHTLEIAGTEEQKEQWLRPLVAGEITSALSMTEPLQGGGADPKMLKTTATLDGDEWVINGHKWWTTQGDCADFLLVFARTDPDAHPYEGTSVILVPGGTEGVNVKRNIPRLEDGVLGQTHAEIIYDNVRVPKENLLGEEGKGFQLLQQRLGPARLTHCMRYSGMAKRALNVAKAYIQEREAFGEPIIEKQAPRFSIAEAEMKLHAVRTMIRHAARQIAAGKEARLEVSMCKVHAANVTQECIDTALQLCGGNGIAKDLPIADFYANVRQFRIVDGPDDVHKRVIARSVLEDVDPDEVDPITRFQNPGS